MQEYIQELRIQNIAHRCNSAHRDCRQAYVMHQVQVKCMPIINMSSTSQVYVMPINNQVSTKGISSYAQDVSI